MQETQVEVKPENLAKEQPIQSSTLKSRFDDAEYERWSETLRNRNTSKGK
jgi:hypothetical protein